MSDYIHAGHHVSLHCENHPELHWHCKVIAVSPTGRYNGCRNIFFSGDDYRDECPCSGSALMIDDDSRATLDAFYAQRD